MNAFETSGTSPGTSDFTIQDEGSIVLLIPHSEAARNWLDEFVGRENGFQPYYPSVVIERRYVGDILDGIESSGLVVSR